MALFRDRADAGRLLAAALERWRGSDAVVVGIPRGGVVVGAAVARELSLPLTAVVVRKLGAPAHEEFAVGAIADDIRLVDERAVRAEGAGAAAMRAVEERERAELRRRSELFAGGPGVAGRPVLVVDDGVATGATATVACRALRARGATEVILAVPVAPARWHPPPDAVDELVCPHQEAAFWAVGQFYADFTQTPDAEVVDLLAGDPRDRAV
ncbi:phosphoribosyltransferase [Microbacterium invictum]|uniref:Phosphoribosyl transferase n=1 Tax=Microbacterium invictum TaxID=515415 RepID=A0AA40SN54_9MICO|nr:MULTISPECIES: phosphoribosyltransferase family protein [Microbacterium]MBB4139224.1 putative phosphoribosyl transferase [Microbacterium invictum]